MPTVKYYPANFVPEQPFKYSVIVAKYNGKWIFCRHKERDTYELPGGHIEADETPLEAAKRELWEETGATDFTIKQIGAYSRTDYGAVFLAKVFELSELPKHMEMAEIILCDVLPDKFTYPDVHSLLFRKAQVYDVLGKTVTVTIDRPIGSVHPKHADLIYPINYGYIDGVIAPDGEGVDVYILGVTEPLKEFTGKVIAIIHRKNDIEDKLVAVPNGYMPTKDEIALAVHFQEQFYDSDIEILEDEQ